MMAFHSSRARAVGFQMFVGVSAFLAVFIAPAESFAALFPVTNTNDSGGGSLRQAITLANASTGADTVDATAIAGTLQLSSGQINITDEVEILGPGMETLTVSGGAQSRIFHIDNAVHVSISDVTLRDGFETSGADGGAIWATYTDLDLTRVVLTNNHADEGGAIHLYQESDLMLESCELSHNTAEDRGGAINAVFDCDLELHLTTVNNNLAEGYTGGGIALYRGDATLTYSSITDNESTTREGGGIWISQSSEDGAGLALLGSTISGNTAGQEGGGILATQSHVTMVNSTVSSNVAGSTGGGENEGGGIYFFPSLQEVVLEALNSTVAMNAAGMGGGIFIDNEDLGDGEVNLHNSIVAGNTAPIGPDLDAFHAGEVFYVDFSLIQNTSGATISGGNNVLNQDPMLTPLGNYGGRTACHMLVEESPAIDTADNSEAPDLDQREYHRPHDGDYDGVATSDMGSTELQDRIFRDDFETGDTSKWSSTKP